MCSLYYRVLNTCQMHIRPFVSYVWASPEYQEMSAKKRKLRELTRTHAFGADENVRMGQRVVNLHI
jgi:hypothetical protein